MSGYAPDASAVVTFWRIWSATTPPVVALTLMFLWVLVELVGELAEHLARDVVLPVPHRDLDRPARLLVVAAAAAAAGSDERPRPARPGS